MEMTLLFVTTSTNKTEETSASVETFCSCLCGDKTGYFKQKVIFYEMVFLPNPNQTLTLCGGCKLSLYKNPFWALRDSRDLDYT